MKHKITISCQKGYTLAENGAQVEKWETVCSPWVEVKNLNGNAFFIAEREGHKKTVRFIMRKRRDKTITEDMRITYKEEMYKILYIDNIQENNRALEIMAEVIKK